MSHVVLQAAEFPSVDLAARCERELLALVAAFARFEATDPSPWAEGRVAPPLVAFGARHGVTWPGDESSRFLIKGLFADEAHVLRCGRVVFFWAGGFELGGEALRAVLVRLGASAVHNNGCHVAVRHADPDARVAELAAFLADEGYEDQFTVEEGASPPDDPSFSVTVIGDHHRRRISFDDSGVQDWAFTAVLPQLSDDQPSLHGAPPRPTG